MSVQLAGVPINEIFQERSGREGGDLYPTLEAALDAVRDGRKALLVETVRIVDLDDEDNRELIAAALSRGLTVALQNAEPERPREKQWAHLYVLAPTELWRIQARRLLLETQKTSGAWTLELEAFNSRLLGYTEEQTRDWLIRLRRAQPAVGAQTLYATLTSGQVAVVEQVGNRCLGTPDAIGEIDVAFVGHNLELKADAVHAIPTTHAFVRFGVTGEFLQRLLGARLRDEVSVVSLSGEQISELNKSLKSRIEVLGRTGWE